MTINNTVTGAKSAEINILFEAVVSRDISENTAITMARKETHRVLVVELERKAPISWRLTPRRRLATALGRTALPCSWKTIGQESRGQRLKSAQHTHQAYAGPEGTDPRQPEMCKTKG